MVSGTAMNKVFLTEFLTRLTTQPEYHRFRLEVGWEGSLNYPVYLEFLTIIARPRSTSTTPKPYQRGSTGDLHTISTSITSWRSQILEELQQR